MLEANYYYGIDAHPQRQMQILGASIIKSEPCPVADSWFFRCDHKMQFVPGFIHELSDDFKFSDEKTDIIGGE